MEAHTGALQAHGERVRNLQNQLFPHAQALPKVPQERQNSPQAVFRQGKIYSFTEVTAGPAGFELEVPYVLAIIELSEGPRLTAQVVGVGEKDVKIGDSVEMIFRRIMEDSEEGLIHYGYKFRLLKK